MLLTDQDYTPWFKGRTKPCRSGVYETRWNSLINPGVEEYGFAYWNGDMWGWMTKMRHQVEMRGSENARQDKEWRGLTEGAWTRLTEGLGS